MKLDAEATLSNALSQFLSALFYILSTSELFIIADYQYLETLGDFYTIVSHVMLSLLSFVLSLASSEYEFYRWSTFSDRWQISKES